MAGAPGLEPGLKVLETLVLPLTLRPQALIQRNIFLRKNQELIKKK